MRRAMSIILCLGACGLGIAACGGSSQPSTTASQGIATTPTSEVVRPPEPDFVVLVVGKTISGGGRKTVKLGQIVSIKVVADTTDEIHLHGYDKRADVSKGIPATLTFKADVPGIFVVELETAGLKLLDLVVK